MNIVVYIPTASIYVGGGERVPLMQAQYLAARGHNVTVMTVQTSRPTDVYAEFKKRQAAALRFIELKPSFAVTTERTEALSHEATHELYFALTDAANRQLRALQPDKVIVHYSAGMIGLEFPERSIFMLHGVPAKADRVSYSAARLAGKLVAVSQSVADGWAELFAISRPEISVVHNGIDTGVFKPEAKVQSTIDVLYVGRLVDIKGLDYLIDAVGILTKERKLKLVIAGTGPLKDSLQAHARDAGINYEFLGYVADSELPALYRRARVAVFPSIAKEGVLTTMLEAAASGVPIVTSDCCGMTDFAVHLKNALLAKPGDAESIASQIDSLLGDRELAERLGQQAFRDIHNSWTWPSAVERLEKVLNR